MTKKNTNAGFSLLEMVVALAIISGISVVLSQVFLTTVRTNTKTEVIKDLKQNGDVALEAITRAVQSAKSITCDSATSLTVVNADATTNTFACVSNGSQTRLSKTDATGLTYLTADSVTMGGADCDTTTFTVTCTDISGSPGAVAVKFSLAANGLSSSAFEQASQTFETSITMRNVQ